MADHVINRQQIGRLAFRHEGAMWNAYYAPSQHSMDGATLLGSLAMSAATRSDPIRQAFVSLMRLAVTDIMKEAFGVAPDWGRPVAAPERERSGHG